jgi:hypothetical protein
MSAMSRQVRYQLRHRRAGLCHDCSRPVVNGGLFCEVHRRKRNLKNRKWQRRKFQRQIGTGLQVITNKTKGRKKATMTLQAKTGYTGVPNEKAHVGRVTIHNK